MAQRRRQRFDAALTAEPVDRNTLAELAWSGVPADLSRCEVWQLLLGYRPVAQGRCKDALQRKRQEYRELRRNFYEASPAVAAVAAAAKASEDGSAPSQAAAAVAGMGGSDAEAALLKQLHKDRRSNVSMQKRQEDREYQECTFKPRIFTRSQDRNAGNERSSSCGAVVDTQDGRHYESPRGQKLQKLLVQQSALVNKFADIDGDAEQVRSGRKGYSQADQQKDVDLCLFKRNLEVVHSLDRLDMMALELPQAQLDILLTMGYRLGLGEKGRRGIISPREASRKAIVETPRNNLRESLVASSSPFYEDQATTRATVLKTATAYNHVNYEL